VFFEVKVVVELQPVTHSEVSAQYIYKVRMNIFKVKKNEYIYLVTMNKRSGSEKIPLK
jgi:hypothetical protein